MAKLTGGHHGYEVKMIHRFLIKWDASTDVVVDNITDVCSVVSDLLHSGARDIAIGHTVSTKIVDPPKAEPEPPDEAAAG